MLPRDVITWQINYISPVLLISDLTNFTSAFISDKSVLIHMACVCSFS